VPLPENEAAIGVDIKLILRTRMFAVSAMKRKRPSGSTARPEGLKNDEDVPTSTTNRPTPSPYGDVTAAVPPGAMRRITLLFLSATKMTPFGCTATPAGASNLAERPTVLSMRPAEREPARLVTVQARNSVDGTRLGEAEMASGVKPADVDCVADDEGVALLEGVPVPEPVEVDVKVADDVFDPDRVGVTVPEPVELGVFDGDAPGDRVEDGDRDGELVALGVAVAVSVSADELDPDNVCGDGVLEAPTDGLPVVDMLVDIVVVADGVVVPDGVLDGERAGDAVPEGDAVGVGVDVAEKIGELLGTADEFSPMANKVPLGAFVVT
jgi:hypothetical protein